MRRVAEDLGAEAMSLTTVASRRDLLDGIADAVVAGINDVMGRLGVPSAGAQWKAAARPDLAARQVCSGTPGPAGVRGGPAGRPALLPGLVRLIDGGFSWDLITTRRTRSAAGRWGSAGSCSTGQREREC
jgi:hypothetical protein